MIERKNKEWKKKQKNMYMNKKWKQRNPVDPKKRWKISKRIWQNMEDKNEERKQTTLLKNELGLLQYQIIEGCIYLKHTGALARKKNETKFDIWKWSTTEKKENLKKQ